MALERKTSVAVGLATAAGVWMIYQNKLPAMVDVRANGNNDADASAAEKTARWTSAVLVVGVSVLTADATVFILGALALLGESWAHRHANAYDPMSGGVVVPPPRPGLFGNVKVSAGVSA